MNNLIYIGYITGPFGLKGEVKVLSDNNHLDKIFIVGNKLIIDNNEVFIKTCRKHQNYYLITFYGFNDINQINQFLKKDIYISRKDLQLKDDEFLYSEIIGFDIIDTNKKIGVVEELLLNKDTVYIKSDNLIIPLIPKYLEKVDSNTKIVYVKSSRELIL